VALATTDLPDHGGVESGRGPSRGKPEARRADAAEVGRGLSAYRLRSRRDGRLAIGGRAFGVRASAYAGRRPVSERRYRRSSRRRGVG
jgi:hypothetical protein